MRGINLFRLRPHHMVTQSEFNRLSSLNLLSDGGKGKEFEDGKLT